MYVVGSPFRFSNQDIYEGKYRQNNKGPDINDEKEIKGKER